MILRKPKQEDDSEILDYIMENGFIISSQGIDGTTFNKKNSCITIVVRSEEE